MQARTLSGERSPVPWMLEAAIALELVMGKFFEATVIGVLLLFNAGLSYFQEGRAQATLAALKSRLAIRASVRRDGIWKLVPAAELVPGDWAKLSLGGLVPADAKVLLDQSLVTGESASVEAGGHDAAYAGALIRRGEAVAEVTGPLPIEWASVQAGSRGLWGDALEQTHFLPSDRLDVAYNPKAENVATEGRQSR